MMDLPAPVASSFGTLLRGVGSAALELRGLGPAVGVALAVAGVLLLALAHRFPHVAAAVGGAAVGALAGLALAGLAGLHLGLSPAFAIALCAAAGFAAGLMLPPLFPALAGALAGGLLGTLAPVDGVLGIAGGAVLLGAVGLLGARRIAGALVGAGAGVALGLGALAAAGARPPAPALVAHPAALLGLLVVLAVAGAAYQLGRSGAPAGPLPSPGPPRPQAGGD